MQSILMMWMPSGMEWAIILVLVVMLFGLGKLPQVAKQMGAGVRDFQRSLRGDEEDEEDEAEPNVARKELESEEPTTAKPLKDGQSSHVVS
tara:strand:- start:16 stop:288 length:273 start_codon:yes stop_codon:yes gene_type:complete